jgi:hypothetical protein
MRSSDSDDAVSLCRQTHRTEIPEVLLNQAARVFVALSVACTLLVASGQGATHANLQNPWSRAAVWDQPDNWFDDLQRDCGSPPFLSPERAEDLACIADAMRAMGADAEAVRFFAATKQFLLHFDERGTVDLGVAGAPWFNMNRPMLVFLNGEPSIISLFDVVAGANVAPVDFGQPFPWPEYGRVEGTSDLLGGGQQILVSIPLRECRACPDVGQMLIRLRFNGAGVLQGVDVLP